MCCSINSAILRKKNVVILRRFVLFFFFSMLNVIRYRDFFYGIRFRRSIIFQPCFAFHHFFCSSTVSFIKDAYCIF